MFAAVEIADSIQQGLNSLIGFIPNIIGFLVILLIGYIVAKLVKTALNKILESTGVDRALHNSDAGKYVERVSPGSRPSHLIGTVAFWFPIERVRNRTVGPLTGNYRDNMFRIESGLDGA